MGVGRDLQPDEIVSQYLEAAEALKQDPTGDLDSIKNLVYMGMGEPFFNFDAVASSLDGLITHHGFHSGIITVSTIGIPDLLVPFGKAFPNVRLAVSLHAATNDLRDQLVPVNRKWPLEQLMAACREYNDEIGRLILFEYILIKGVNDTLTDARALGTLLNGMNAKVNLIPMHPGGNAHMHPTPKEDSDAFRSELLSVFKGHVTFRRSRGLDIEAACGQLAVNS